MAETVGSGTNKNAELVGNAVRLFSDFAVVPGLSQILDGNYKPGLAHAAVGVVSRAFLLHPIGLAVWAFTAANSYSLSVRGKNLLDFQGVGSTPAQGSTSAPAQPATSPPTPAGSGPQ